MFTCGRIISVENQINTILLIEVKIKAILVFFVLEFGFLL